MDDGYFTFQDPQPGGKFSGRYPLAMAERIIRASLGKVDPHYMLGTAMAETNFGKHDRHNPYNDDEFSGDFGGHENELMYDKEGRSISYDEAVDRHATNKLARLLQRHNDPKVALQGWQGYGKLGPSTERYLYGGKSQRWFGRRTVDAGKELPHGKRVYAFADTFRTIPEVQQVIQKVKNERLQSEAASNALLRIPRFAGGVL
jgi:hypothetical protein